MPCKEFQITPKHRRFVKAFVSHGNTVKAARQVGFGPRYAHTLVHHNKIKQLILEAQAKLGLTDELLLRTHMELLSVGSEGHIRLGALRLAYQVNKKIGADGDQGPVINNQNLTIMIVRDASGDAGKANSRVPIDTTANVSVRRADEQ